MADVQASADSRNVAIDDVGIKGLRYPLCVAGRDGLQHTVAEIDLMVGLEPEVKGTHMSRFVELIDAWKAPLDASSLAALASAMTARLGAERGTIDMRFPYFIRKQAPVSGVESLLEHRASIDGPGTPCPPDLLRLSVGVEDSGDLFDDLDQALRRADNA